MSDIETPLTEIEGPIADNESPVINLTVNETTTEKDCFREKLGISRNVIISILVCTVFGISLILISFLVVAPISATFRTLMTVLGVILSTPILFLFFHLYHFFIPPLYPSFEDNEVVEP